MANSKLVCKRPVKGPLLIYFPARFHFDHTVAIMKSRFSTFLILWEGCFTSLEKIAIFFLENIAFEERDCLENSAWIVDASET